jgi:MFS family permease
MVLLLTAVYFCVNVTGYGLSMFMPAIIKSQAGGASSTADVVASALAALPYVMALVGMLVNGWHSDRTGERPWHVAVPMAVLGLAIWLTAVLTGVPVWPVVIMIFLVGPFMYAQLPAFWPIPTAFLGATAAASAIGFINMIGNLGGSVGSTLVGKLATSGTDFSEALKVLAPWPLAGAFIIAVLGYLHRKPASPPR